MTFKWTPGVKELMKEVLSTIINNKILEKETEFVNILYKDAMESLF